MDGPDGCLASNTNLSAQDGAELESIVASVVESRGGRAAIMYPRFAKIVGFYQEQPQLLDPVLDIMVSPLALLFLSRAGMEEEREEEEMGSVLETVARYLWLVSSVRSPKTVVKFFPNDVSNLEPVVNLVTNDRPSPRAWEVDYVALLWLSLLVMVPFDLAVVDSSYIQVSTASSPPPIAIKLLSLCRYHLSSPGATREMAALLTARLLLRPDITPKTMMCEEFIESGIDILQSPKEDTSNFLLLGIASTFAMLLKLGHNEGKMRRLADKVLPLSVDLFKTVTSSTTPTTLLGNVLFRKLIVKLAQRSALCYLPQKTIEDARAVEAAIEVLLVGLQDKDTIVRWSAAKGMGRVICRLQSKEAKNDVLACILDAMDDTAGGQDDGVWHGGCLALAELSRRGVLSPASTPPALHDRAIGTIASALEFDRRQGHRSVGAHVRDAAAYACWAMARAAGRSTGENSYSTNNAAAALAPFLITLACLDREVNCRRAGAAAFQEWVGRSGNIPHGIDVVTTADYYSVSLRTKAYLRIMPRVASLPGEVYFKSFVMHLMHKKIHHWDTSVRELAAKALAELVPVNAEFFVVEVLPFLVSLCLLTEKTSIYKGTNYPTIVAASVETRQGALAATGEVLFGLAKYYNTDDAMKVSTLGFRNALPPPLVDSILSIVPFLQRKALMKGKGGEIVRGAACRLIEATFLCFGNDHFAQSSAFDEATCYAVAFETLGNSNYEVQHKAAAAIAAISAFGMNVVTTNIMTVNEKGQSQIVADLIRSLKLDTHEAALRRGAALALGSLSFNKINGYLKDGVEDSSFDDAMSSLIATLHKDKDVTVRKEAAIALYRLALEKDAVDVILESIDTLMQDGLGDYASDARGDVGSWVREVSIIGIHRLVVRLTAHPACDDAFYASRVSSVIGRSIAVVAKQACERIERLREVASEAIRGMLQACLAMGKARLNGDNSVVEKMAGILCVPFVFQMTADECANNNMVDSDTDEEPFAEVDSGSEYTSLSEKKQHNAPLRRSLDLDVLARLLAIDIATRPILQGLAYSIGGIDARLSGEAQAALSSAINDLTDNGISSQSFVQAFVELWSSCTTSRMTASFIATADVLLSQTDVFTKFELSSCNDDEEGQPLNPVSKIIRLIERGVVRCSDVARLRVAASALCSAVSFSLSMENRKGKILLDESSSVLLSLLGNRYPKVRVYTAEQLYTTLLSVSPEDISGVDEALALLGEVAWDGPMEVVRPVLSRVMETLGVSSCCSPNNAGSPDRSGMLRMSAEEEAQAVVEDSNARYGALLKHVERGM